MLTLEERNKAINLLTDNEVNYVNNNGGTYGQFFKDALRNGFRGFASYNDEELLRALNKISKNGNWNASQFLTTLAAEKFLL